MRHKLRKTVSAEKIKEVLRLRESGRKVSTISNKTGIGHLTVNRILRGEYWPYDPVSTLEQWSKNSRSSDELLEDVLLVDFSSYLNINL